MSIASEIQRIQTAKENIKASLVLKGVEVSDTDTLDTYAGKIDSIQASDNYYDEFWDSYQQNGERTNYGQVNQSNAGFSNPYWNDVTFKPKYDIIPTEAYGIFSKSKITDFANCGVDIDFSKCGDFRAAFSGCEAVHIGTVDLRKCSYQLSTIFYGCTKLETIDKLILKVSEPKYNSTFDRCSSLTNLTAEGTVGGSISFASSPLSLASAKSLIACLKNYADTDAEFTYTITFSETTWGYLDAEGETASPNDNSWREYINDIGWNAS